MCNIIVSMNNYKHFRYKHLWNICDRQNVHIYQPGAAVEFRSRIAWFRHNVCLHIRFRRNIWHIILHTHTHILIYIYVCLEIYLYVYMQTQTPCTSQCNPASLLPSCCLLKTLPTYHLNKNEAPHPHTHLQQEFVLANVFMSVLSTPIDEFIIRGSTECVCV